MNNNRQAGVTLVELIISIVVISIALVGIFTVINLTSSTSANPVVQYQAIAIAESYMEEILLQAYCDPAGPCTTQATLGSESDEGRATYDDVDDFNGLSDSGAQNSQGKPIALLSAYVVKVKVFEEAVAGLPAKVITVTVTGPGTPKFDLTGYAFLAG
jgi:MSHA pilin protein MshD